MPAAELQPLWDVAALKVAPPGRSPYLVIADLHLGLGAHDAHARGPPNAEAAGLAEILCRAARSAQLRSIVVAGDVKQPIVGTPRPLRPVIFDFFSTLLAEGLRVEVVLGNHDVGLTPHLPREVRVAPATGIVRGGVGIFHGHGWPSRAVLRAGSLVVGHLHPGVRLAPTADEDRGKVRCWVRATRRPAGPPTARGSRTPTIAAEEVVVVPAFNPITGTEALNRQRPSRGRSFLFRRFLAGAAMRAYLLDGTDLGELVTPGDPDPRPKGAGRRPPGR
ncbi:MAG: metallophosphoesterase [Thermoplasmata archaeon]|nr:metallophosphoesterase [Thermoplasmata archaeon]